MNYSNGNLLATSSAAVFKCAQKQMQHRDYGGNFEKAVETCSQAYWYTYETQIPFLSKMPVEDPHN
tara:strand:+ start:745 stop:942 length:198 start_codon:yes stop_codon:yes gene_type:complete